MDKKKRIWIMIAMLIIAFTLLIVILYKSSDRGEARLAPSQPIGGNCVTDFDCPQTGMCYTSDSRPIRQICVRGRCVSPAVDSSQIVDCNEINTIIYLGDTVTGMINDFLERF